MSLKDIDVVLFRNRLYAMHVCKGLKKEALKTNLIDQQLQFTSESWLGHAIVIVYILVPNRDVFGTSFSK